MKIVDDYISIQHTRFADRVRLRWRVAPDLAPDTLAVPAFLLQPIVENAVIHGLEPKVEGGLIRIRIHMRENALHIIISDNGVGMPREILDTLLQQQSAKGDVSGIGMGNVRTRLQMLYPQARFTLHSAIGRGTCVHIVIPDPHRIEGANEWAAAQQKGGAPA
jgi:sensor histidine kinase YesM